MNSAQGLDHFLLWVYPIKKIQSRHILFAWPHPAPRSSEAKPLLGNGFFPPFQKLYGDQFQAHELIGKVTRTIQLKESQLKKKKSLGPDCKKWTQVKK